MDRKRTFEKSSCSEQSRNPAAVTQTQQEYCPCCRQENCLNLACVRKPGSNHLSIPEMLRVRNEFGDPFGLDSFGLSSTMQDPLSSAFSSMTRHSPFGGALPMTRTSHFSVAPRKNLLRPQAQNNGNSEPPIWNPPNMLNGFPRLPQLECRTRTEFQQAIASAFEEAYPCLKGITEIAARAKAKAKSQRNAEGNPNQMVMAVDEDEADSEAKTDDSASESESEAKAEAVPKKTQHVRKRKSSQSRKKRSTGSTKSTNRKAKASRPKKTAVRRCRTKSAVTTRGAKGRSVAQPKARSAACRRRSASHTRKTRRNARRN